MKMTQTDWDKVVEYLAAHPSAIMAAGTRPDGAGKYLIMRVPSPVAPVGPLYIPVELE